METNGQEFGLLGVFIGCLAEGEATLLASAYAVHRGWLAYGTTFSVALAATIVFDWTAFFLGRYGIHQLYTRFPTLEARMQRPSQLAQKYNLQILVFYRFLYGLRTLVILALSTTKLSTYRFLVGSFLGASLWVGIYLTLGFSISNLFSRLLPVFQQHRGIGLAGLLSCLVLVGAYFLYRKKSTLKN